MLKIAFSIKSSVAEQCFLQTGRLAPCHSHTGVPKRGQPLPIMTNFPFFLSCTQLSDDNTNVSVRFRHTFP